MRIIIDLQGLQREGNRQRGIGRYCLEFTKSLINYFPENEYILFTNSALCSLRNDFSDELNNKKFNLIYFECPIVGDMNQSYVGLYSKLWLSIQLRSYALSIINADIILITSFFDGFRDNTLVSHDNSFKLPPIVSIIYDCIPLIYSDMYLNCDPEYKLFYLQKLKDISNLDALLAISESSSKEAAKYLNINSDSIFNISSACDEKKFSLKIDNSNSNRKFLGKFLLYCGATDPRKNLCRLIEAYASLPLDLIIKHKLVLTGPYTNEETLLIKEWSVSFGLPTEYIVFLGFVDDDELANLYRSCYLFVFPSLHEGFGLPVLEAMNCGAPVIASKQTSLPELIGDHRFLFDPQDPNEISSLIYKSLTNQQFYESICSNSRERSKYFSWKYTCRKTLESLEKVINRKSSFLNRKKPNYTKLVENKYDILKTNVVKSQLVKVLNNDNSQYLKSLASAISIINNQSKKIELIRLSNNNKKFIWHIEGPFDTSYSLAILNRNYALAMDNLEQDVLLFSTEGPGDYEPDSRFLDKNPLVNKLYQNSICAHDSFFICTRNLYPPRVNDVTAPINLLHSYGWEESEFPTKWVNEFNANLDGMTVMSKFVKKILIDNGVKIPITVSGLGLDHIDRIDAEYEPNKELKKYKILHVSSCFERKGIDILLHAYGKAFSIHDDVTLIIKTFVNPHNKIYQILNTLKNKNPLFPHVFVIQDDYEDSQLKGLYLQSNILVAPSRGEGFGLPIGEAMRLGIPVITTGWGGQLDFVNDENSWLIDYEFTPSLSHFNLDQSYWAEPSCDHLFQLLLELFNSSESQIRLKTEAAKKSINSFTWKSVAQSNIDFIKEKIAIFDNNQVNLGCISTWNSKCGIASYSKNLLANLHQKVTIFTPFSEEKFDSNNIDIVPSWSLGKNNNSEDLVNQITIKKITSLLIQFNYGFFDFSDLSKLIHSLYTKGVNIILLLHSTNDPVQDKTKSLFKLTNSLKLCDRILVHSIDDLNRLKKIDIIDNVCLFPHGIVDYKPKKNKFTSFLLNKKVKHIGTYGFCLPNKGFHELVKAVHILKERKFDIRLSIFSAIYSDEYTYVYEDLSNLVKDLKLENHVKIDVRYLNIQQILDKLSICDCLIFPYQDSNESSSASVRDGLATLRPTLVTPSEIFNDVSDLVNYLPGFTPEEIADGIYDWFSNSYKLSGNSKEDLNYRSQLINSRRFSEVSVRLMNIIKSLEIN